MSTTVKDVSSPVGIGAPQEIAVDTTSHPAHWKGFVAGVFSGVAKLTGSKFRLLTKLSDGVLTDS
jgi:hypothetical protein